MKRRHFLWALGSAAILAGPAAAQSMSDDIVRQLRQQGFTEVTVNTTMLGRVRIMGERRSGSREIILNPKTGEILRDLWLDRSGNPEPSSILSDDGDLPDDADNDDDDDDDDDDDRDDDDDDDDDDDSDNSGSGSGGSGNSGSGNSGSGRGDSGRGGGDDNDNDDDDDD